MAQFLIAYPLAMPIITLFRRRWRRAYTLTAGVWTMGLCLSVVGAWRVYVENEKSTSDSFQRYVRRVADEVAHRFQQPVSGLNGLGGLYAAYPEVKRRAFRAYVQARDLPDEFPGVRGFGFIQRVPAQNKDVFLAAQRADEAPEFAIRQLEETGRDELLVIQFIEPQGDNVGAQGLDLASESKRRTAAQQAIDTGLPATTEAITLVQDQRKTPGVLIYVPVYAPGSHPQTSAQRRATLRGLLYAPIVMHELLDKLGEVANGQANVEIYDSADATAATRPIYDTNEHPASGGKPAASRPRYQSLVSVPVPGRSLTARVSGTELFAQRHSSQAHWLWLLSGTLLSTVLALLIHQQATGRRRAETLARQMTAELNRLALVAKKTSNAVVITDTQRRITWVNAGFERISGYSAQEVLGLSPAILQTPETDASTLEHMRNALNAGQTFRGELLNRSKHGVDYWLDIEIQPLRDEKGKLSGFMAIESDITALVRATEAAREASRSKSQFLANMSHEIRTPMNAILGMLTLLRKTELTPRQADYAAKSEGAAQSLLGLLNDILDLSKAESGKMELDTHPCSLERLIADLHVIVSAYIGTRPVELVLDMAAGLPTQLMADALRLKQVLINLCSNAVKFTPQGLVTLSVHVVDRSDTAVMLKFAVQDEGIGIAPDKQVSIFSAFSQAEASTTRRFGGTGLGLAISQRLIALMGGKLELHSVLGKGSRFYFTLALPIVSVAPDTPTAQAEPGQRSPGLAGLRVLVVEDNFVNQQIANELLRGEGAEVTLANHGQEALECLAQTPQGFDAVLMDMQMPVMDGLQATREIRKQFDASTLPIVAMTANAMDADRQACLDAGMNDHIGKPFNLAHLVAVLRQLTGLEGGSGRPGQL